MAVGRFGIRKLSRLFSETVYLPDLAVTTAAREYSGLIEAIATSPWLGLTSSHPPERRYRVQCSETNPA